MSHLEIYQPSLKSFRELADGAANLIPVSREFAADLETPVSVYIKLMSERGASFLLESVEGGEQIGRYSFVGVNPRGTVSLNGRSITTTIGDNTQTRTLNDGEDILHVLKAEMSQYVPADMPGLPASMAVQLVTLAMTLYVILNVCRPRPSGCWTFLMRYSYWRTRLWFSTMPAIASSSWQTRMCLTVGTWRQPTWMPFSGLSR